MLESQRYVAKVTTNEKQNNCHRTIRQCFRYSKLVVKNPSCQVFKSVLNTTVLVVTTKTHVDIPYVNDNTPYVVKSLLYLAFHLLRHFSIIGIEEMDVIIVLVLILWTRRSGSTNNTKSSDNDHTI